MKHKFKKIPGSEYILLVGFGCIVAFYLFDALMDSLIFHEGGVAEQILAPSHHELAIRLLGVSIMAVLLFYAWAQIKSRQVIEGRLNAALCEFEEEKNKCEAILAGMGDGISIQSLDYKVLFQNEAHKALLGGDFVGGYCYRAYRGRESVCEDCPVGLTFQDGLVHGEEIWVSVGGKKACLEVTASPLRDSNGNIAGGIKAVRDISERKKTEVELRKTNRELDAFVYTVSHDLRTPLTPILGYSEILRENYGDILDEPAHDYLNEIEEQGNKMLTLIEDLLSLSRAGQIECPAEPVNAAEVVAEVIKDLKNLIDSAGTEVRNGPMPQIHIPRAQLGQVFENLIGNALRYAGREGGPIEVGGERKGDKVLFYVRNHGPGIPVEERELIFEVFYRGSTGKDMRGTGVGLATVQKIAELFGGRAWVDETPGGGSTFWVEMTDMCPVEDYPDKFLA